MFAFSKPIEMRFTSQLLTIIHTHIQHLYVLRTYHLKSGQEALKNVLAGIR